MHPQPYVAGLDGGGTKTRLMCIDAQGRILAEGVFGPLNINSGSLATIQTSLKEAVELLFRLPGGQDALAGLCIATAGLSNPQAKPQLEAALKEAGYAGPLLLRGDQEAALMGAVGPVGAVLIAGTGSICYGVNEQGQSARTGGYGHLVDDVGSGYAIGRDIISAMLRAQDGRGPRTLLSDLVYERLQTRDLGEVIRFVYTPLRDKRDIASLSSLLQGAVAQGDEAALAIAQRAAEDLGTLCLPVLEQLGLQQGSLAFMGGVLDNHPYIDAALRQRLAERYPGLRIMKARQSAAYGAAALARAAFL